MELACRKVTENVASMYEALCSIPTSEAKTIISKKIDSIYVKSDILILF